MKRSLAALTTFLLPVLLQAQVDSTNYGRAEMVDTADSDPGLFMFMMFFLMLFVAVILFTAILTILIAAFTVLLVFTGVISASVLTGLYHQSFAKGATTFVRIMLLLAGTGVGFMVGVAAIFLKLVPLSHFTTMAVSILLGLVAGWVTTNLFLKTSRLLMQKVMAKKG